jgi:hypothetical protein
MAAMPDKKAPASPNTFNIAQIDQAIRAEWKKEKVVPAAPVDDARYLRRIYLDITGTIPTADAVEKFLSDPTPNRRAKAVDELLNSERYALHWTNYWDNVLMGKQVRSQLVDRVAFRNWLYTQFSKSVPYNKFVYDLITASGVNSNGSGYRNQMNAMATKPQMIENEEVIDTGGGITKTVNGAVNWYLKYAMNPADLSGTASRVFMGVQIQCAQCHDHKTEKWKQQDFKNFTACFTGARPVPVDNQQMQGNVRRLDLRDIQLGPVGRRMQQRMGRAGAEYATAEPKALDGTSFDNSPSRRQGLASWMTARENPYFAEAIVNRMWAHFMGRGFVEPIDDFRPSNPATMPALMKQLADDFTASDYDLKHLIRTICATQAYQLSSGPAKADDDNKYWARYRLKPMQPEVLLDSLMTATSMEPLIQKIAGQNLDAIKSQIVRQFTFLFDVDEENEQKEFEGTIPQALMFLNGGLVNGGASNIPGTALAEVLAMSGTDRQKIQAMYLRTLSRKPTEAEMTKWAAFVNEPRDVVSNGAPPQQGPSGPAEPPPGLTPIQRRQFMRMQQARMQELRKKMMEQVKQGGGRRNPGDPLANVGSRLVPNAPTAKSQAYEDLFWALLNSSEFIFNH